MSYFLHRHTRTHSQTDNLNEDLAGECTLMVIVRKCNSDYIDERNQQSASSDKAAVDCGFGMGSKYLYKSFANFRRLFKEV